jgi:hypothetical protein
MGDRFQFIQSPFLREKLFKRNVTVEMVESDNICMPDEDVSYPSEDECGEQSELVKDLSYEVVFSTHYHILLIPFLDEHFLQHCPIPLERMVPCTSYFIMPF